MLSVAGFSLFLRCFPYEKGLFLGVSSTCLSHVSHIPELLMFDCSYVTEYQECEGCVGDWAHSGARSTNSETGVNRVVLFLLFQQ